MNDGQSESGKPKKKPDRAAGGPKRRAPGPARAAGSSSERPRRPREDSAGSSERPRRPREESGRASDRPRRPDDDRRRSATPRARREEKPREESAPGFGPFKGGERAAKGERERGRAEEARSVRAAAEEAIARGAGRAARPSLRIVKSAEGPDTPPKSEGWKTKKKRAAPSGAPVTARPKVVRDVDRLQQALINGSRNLDRGYEREALRILRPYRDPHPDSADLRELLGVTYYRLGRWSLAQKELEAYVALTDATDQHPVLMDCARAQGKYKRVETLWDELRNISPGAEVVSEGRIVAAGALADRGKLDEAIKMLERAPASPKRVLPHHLRLWYALADLQERAGDIPAARALFRKISAQDPSFVDVAERLAALS